MAINEPGTPRTGVSTGRLETLTDGVFAIAMTLLVLELRVPSLPDALVATRLVGEMQKLLPNFFSFVLSFVVLGVYWVEHHRAYRYIRRADHISIWLNIFFLLFISLIPFSAEMLGRYGDQEISVIIYGANLLASASLRYAMWAHATGKAHLIDSEIDHGFITFVRRISLFPIIAYILAIAVSPLSTGVAIAIFALAPLPYVLGIIYRLLKEPE